MSIKAAKRDNSGKIVPLNIEERYNFSSYIDAIKFAGVDTNVISTSADRLRYNLEVYFDPAIPNTLVQEYVEKAPDDFKASLGFDSMIYKQQFIDAVMNAEGVVTCNLVSQERKGVTDTGFAPVGIYPELESGYFEYDPDCVATLKYPMCANRRYPIQHKLNHFYHTRTRKGSLNFYQSALDKKYSLTKMHTFYQVLFLPHIPPHPDLQIHIRC